MSKPPERPQRIVITGVTRGLGHALVSEFVGRGHTVIGCGRSVKAVEELTQRFGGAHDFFPVNVASDDEVKSWASLVLVRHGAPDLLINNAALMNRSAPLWDIPAREFDEVMDVNIKGVANVVRHFVPAMVRKKHGVIVNLSSGWGRATDAEVAPYCATKWAVEGLTQSLAQELPPGHGSRAAQPRHHQHRHAPSLLARLGEEFSDGGAVGRAGRGVPAQTGAGAQRTAPHRSGCNVTRYKRRRPGGSENITLWKLLLSFEL